jgi:hypothetical protein
VKYAATLERPDYLRLFRDTGGEPPIEEWDPDDGWKTALYTRAGCPVEEWHDTAELALQCAEDDWRHTYDEALAALQYRGDL